METPIKMDDLGVPLFLQTPILIAVNCPFFSGNPSWWSESHLEHIVSNRTTSTTMFQEVHFNLSLLMWAAKPKHDMVWIYSFPGNSGKWRFPTISTHFQGRTCCMLISGTVTWNLKMPVSKRIFRWTMLKFECQMTESYSPFPPRITDRSRPRQSSSLSALGYLWTFHTALFPGNLRFLATGFFSEGLGETLNFYFMV